MLWNRPYSRHYFPGTDLRSLLAGIALVVLIVTSIKRLKHGYRLLEWQ